MSSSDDDALSPQRIRPSLKRDQISSSKRASPIVTAAARRQLRGGTPDQKSAAEIAAEYRRRLYEPEKYAAESRRIEPPAADDKVPPSASPQSPDRPTSHTEGAVLTTSALLSPAAPKANGQDRTGNETPSQGEDDGPKPRMVTIQRRANYGGGGPPPGSDIGIGIKFVPNDEGEMTVTSLLPGAPAMESNKIFPGDVIVAVSQVYVHGKTSDEVKSLIMGKPGTSVDLIIRKGKPSFNTTSPLISSPSPSKPSFRKTQLATEQHPTPAKTEPSPPKPATLGTAKQGPESVAVDQSNVSIELADQATPGKKASPSKAKAPSALDADKATRNTGGGASTMPPKTPGGSDRAGIGIRFGIDVEDRVAVIDVWPGSPASQKIQSKNRIMSVDRVPVHGKTAHEIEDLIAGPEGTEVELEIASTMDGHDVNLVKLTRKSAMILPENELKDIVSSDRDKNTRKEITAVNDDSQASMPEKQTKSIVHNTPSKEVGAGRAQQLSDGVTRQDLKALQLEFQNELKHLQKQLLSKLDGIQSEVKRPDESGSQVDKRLGLIESAMQSQGQALKSLKGMEAQVEELIKEKMERESNKGCCAIS